MLEELRGISPEDRVEAFLDIWVSGEGLEFASEEAREAYRYRAGLLKDAILLKKTPDRVPILPLATFAPTTLAGMSGKQAMNDPDGLGKAWLKFVDDYEPDALGGMLMVMYAPVLEALDYKLYKWPGHGVPEHLYYQFNEQEYMKADEYDHFIQDVTDYWIRVWLPRTHGALGPLAGTFPVYGSMELPMSSPWLMTLGIPEVQDAFKALLEAGRLTFEWFQKMMPYVGQKVAKGFPESAGGFTKAPFDVLADSFRGTTGIMMDLFRQPDKVLKAVEVLTPLMINLGVSLAKVNRNPLVFIPLHKGADGFMSNAHFEKFYWPSLKNVMLGLIENGCVPVCFVEGAYNQRLEYLTELPPGKCVFYFDRTDMARAKEVLAGKSCIAGGFPVSLIMTGKPEQVEAEVKKLLNQVAPNGGYILGVGTALDDPKPENLKAFMEAGRKFGKY